MKNIDKLLHLSNFLYNEYTERTFNPKTQYQTDILYSIIKQDAEERFNINNISHVELNYVIHQVRGYYNIENKREEAINYILKNKK